MTSITRSLAAAFINLFHPRMLWLMVWPVLIALAVWGTLVFAFWAEAVIWLAAVLKAWITSATFFLNWDAADFAVFSAKVLVVLMLVPLVQLTALLILAVFGMSAMVAHVASRYYPSLAMRRGGSFTGSLWNSVIAIFGLAGFAVLSLPFWLFPPLWPVIPLAVMGWVNQRVLRYDALAEHAGGDEMERVFADRRAGLYAMGVLLALVAYVPVVGFFAPVLVSLAFIHYLLGALQALRAEPIEGVVIDAGSGT